MFPNLKEVINILDEIAPFALAEKWDNSGLQVGSYNQVIRRILVALDPTMEAVSIASSTDVQLLVTHHPLLFRAVSCINFNIYPGNVIHEAVRNNIAIVAVHTNLDSARAGINHILGEKLGLLDVEILDPRELNGEGGYGLGITGSLPEPVDLLSASGLIKNILGLSTVKVIGTDESVIKRIAVVGGSGRDLISIAAEKKADLLVTGDIGHHDALTARALGLNIIDAGHFSTERFALTGFIKKLEDLFAGHHMDIVLKLHEDERDPARTI